VEGRKIWEQILSVSRDLSRMIKLYETRPKLLYRKLLDPKYKRDPEHSLLLYDDLANFDDDAEAAGLANEEESTGESCHGYYLVYMKSVIR